MLTNMSCRRCGCRGRGSCHLGFPAGNVASVGNNSDTPSSACTRNKDGRSGLVSCFNHMGCSFVSHCLLRTGVHTSTSSHFRGSGH